MVLVPPVTTFPASQPPGATFSVWSRARQPGHLETLGNAHRRLAPLPLLWGTTPPSLQRVPGAGPTHRLQDRCGSQAWLARIPVTGWGSAHPGPSRRAAVLGPWLGLWEARVALQLVAPSAVLTEAAPWREHSSEAKAEEGLSNPGKRQLPGAIVRAPGCSPA